MNNSNVTTNDVIQATQAEQPTPQQWQFPTILRSYQWNKEDKRGQVQLYNYDNSWDCATFSNPTYHFDFQDVTGYARVIRSLNQANEPIYVMVDFKPDASLNALYLTHPDFCPIEGIVDQTRSLVSSIVHEGIQQFVKDALSLNPVVANFWTCQASLRDHHAYAGGLAQHCVEVATMIASSNLGIKDKDIGIAFALLHDIGKVQSYAQATLTDQARAIGHEGIGYQLLDSLIADLEHEDAEIGHTMHELLNGDRRIKMNGRRPLAIGRVVNAFDQLSCERNLQKTIKCNSSSSGCSDYVSFSDL